MSHKPTNPDDHINFRFNSLHPPFAYECDEFPRCQTSYGFWKLWLRNILFGIIREEFKIHFKSILCRKKGKSGAFHLQITEQDSPLRRKTHQNKSDLK
ncbi:hypothetical protein CEXT_15581 [Caerostris extrusa]|uniref:Uncharacterized protein n=1 Tax=Caerostris extrusa TaxID=172846 RepID=A0AAV4MD89_CAEEX|nr:hypothetical protein CEXT_15581 [Caerostris extrusa]